MFPKCSDWLHIWCAQSLTVVFQLRFCILIFRILIRIHIPDVPYPTSKTSSWPRRHECRKNKWENRVLVFSWSFCLFTLNKSSKQNTATRQARPQLHFAPKIIKIRLTVLENELIEVFTRPYVRIAHSKVLYQSFNKYVHEDVNIRMTVLSVF